MGMWVLRSQGVWKRRPKVNSGGEAIKILSVKDQLGWDGLRRLIEEKD
jgi:hypothetical protein